MRLQKTIINNGKQKRHGMTFFAVPQIKDLNDFQNQVFLDLYEKMRKLLSVYLKLKI
jgi:hypothetical protein